MRIFYKKLISCATVMAILSSATVMATPYSDIYLKEGENRAIINGKVVEIEGKAPVEIDGTLMVPLRFFAEQLGKNVIWEDGFVSISDDETPPSQKDYLISQLVGAPLPSYNDDMQIMTNNLSGAVKNPNADPKDALAKMKPDGSFEGVEYFNSDRDKWTASEHLKYIRTMVQSAYSEGNPLFGNVELKANIAKALEFWANGKIVDSDNWWHKEIGIPNIIVDILLLQPEEVNGEISDLLNAQALEGSIFKEKITDRITERPVKSSGGNLTDKLVTSMKIAVATKNAEELYKVIQLTENELRVFMKIRADEFGEDAEGIKADYSFHQHVDQVQFGGYGEVFVSGINQILKATAGTAFMVSDRALNEYANFILDGMQWSFKGEYKDFTTTGRGFSRQNGNKGIYKPVKAATEILLNYKQLDRYDELETLYKNRCSDNGDKFTGNRQFWLSDYMSHNRDDYHVGIKLASSRTKLGEVINKENLLGYYLSDGVTAIMPTGNEYENIYPLWDWNKIPGTTTPQGGLKKLEDWADWNGEHLWDWKGNRNFVGGVSDGKYGAAVMDYSRDGLDAKKSWFMFDDEMVALGNEINSYTDMNIYTNINQTTRVGDVVMGKNGKISKVSDGTTNTKDADFIWNNGVGYVAKDAEVTLENRTGKWSTINGGNKEGTETKDIFQMGLNHGVKPNNGKYEYRVVFGNTAEEMTEYVKNNPIKVLRNDDKVQAVYNSDLKMVQAVFLKTDTLTLPTGMTIYSNKKCMLMATENSDGSITMTVSNPANEAKDLQITVNKTLPILNSLRMVNGEGTTKIMFRLNEGVYAGSSTTYDSRTGFDENSIMQLDKENINK